ncbi:MAG: CDP-glycerol glycerophosphotransferase family protein [Bacilli bacterium]|nr:CDP-glycerol glycerophosphotransferase family protein [Bacilli bacterium]
MSLVIKLGIFILNIIYFFIKLLPTRHKITFISRQKNVPSKDIEMLYDDLKKKDKSLKIVILCKRLEGNLFDKFKYFLHMFVQMYHIATSKVVVLDSYCICISILKHKKNLKVIQMWHAMGSFKKFGYSILDQKEGSSSKIANLMGMHKNYNYVFTSSEKCKKNFAEAFNVSLDKMVVMPLPCVDLITNPKYLKQSRKRVLDKYPNINDKKVILYAPTFRKNKSMKKDIQKLIDEVNFEKYNLVIKLHPLSKTVIDDERVIFDKDLSTIDVAVVSDYVITDYSAVVFEIALLNKPIFFYAFDKDSYLDDRNFYMDFDKDMPGKISKSPKDLLKSIEKNEFDLKKVKKFAYDNVEKVYGGYTNNVSNFILTVLEKKNS